MGNKSKISTMGELKFKGYPAELIRVAKNQDILVECWKLKEADHEFWRKLTRMGVSDKTINEFRRQILLPKGSK